MEKANNARSRRRAVLGIVVLGAAAVTWSLGSSAGKADLSRPHFVEQPRRGPSAIRVEGRQAEVIPAAPGGAAPRRDRVARAVRRQLRVHCSPTSLALIGSRLERAFEAAHAGVDVVLGTGDDRSCIDHLILGRAEVAMVAVPLSSGERERRLTGHVVGHMLVVPVVHEDNPVVSVSREMLEHLLDGSLAAWEHSGGTRLPIAPVSRPLPPHIDPPAQLLAFRGDAATRCTHRTSDREVLAFVANDARALGLVPLHEARGDRTVRSLQVEGVAAELDAYRAGRWPLGCTFRAVLRPGSGADAQAWVTFLRGDEARRALRRCMFPE